MPRSAPATIAGNGHNGRSDDPAAATLLDRVCRSLAELAATVTALEACGVDPACLKAAIGSALRADLNVVHVLGTLATAGHWPGEARREATLPALCGHGKRPGRKPLDPAKAQAALRLVAAGLSPTAAAHQIGLGRFTVYRELRQSGAQRSSQPTH